MDPNIEMPEAGHHILVVDDEDLVREALCDLLKQAGYQTTGATNGRQALALLRDTPVDLILTDLTMPYMNGW